MRFIDEMRERPEDERLAFAVMIAGAVALVLFLLWGATFFKSTKNIVKIEAPSQEAAAAGSLADFGSEVSNTVTDFSTQYKQLQEALNEAGLGKKQEGVNTVDLSVDENGDVQVGTILVEKEELSDEDSEK